MTPELSVILVVGERRDRAVSALASVLAQEAIDRLEVLLLDLAPGDPPQSQVRGRRDTVRGGRDVFCGR